MQFYREKAAQSIPFAKKDTKCTNEVTVNISEQPQQQQKREIN